MFSLPASFVPLSSPHSVSQIFFSCQTHVWVGEVSLGACTVHVAPSGVVIELQRSENREGFVVDFHHVALHAVSRDPGLHPVGCLFCRIEEPGREDEGTQLIIEPKEQDLLTQLHQAFCDGAELNPDSASEDEGDFVYNSEEVSLAAMERLDGITFGPDENDTDVPVDDRGYDEVFSPINSSAAESARLDLVDCNNAHLLSCQNTNGNLKDASPALRPSDGPSIGNSILSPEQ